MPRNNYEYKRQNINFARQLRKAMTPAEKKLWFLYFRKIPVRVYRQRMVAGYIIDFYCASAKIAIEIDGGQHYDPEMIEEDKKRSEELENLGIRVLRFTNAEVNRAFEAVCEEIDRWINPMR